MPFQPFSEAIDGSGWRTSAWGKADILTGSNPMHLDILEERLLAVVVLAEQSH